MNHVYGRKPNQVERNSIVVNAAGVPLGRLASEVAVLLRGKHKPSLLHPHVGSAIWHRDQCGEGCLNR